MMEIEQSTPNELARQDQSLKDELENIIAEQRIDTLFQPIFDITGTGVFAYEALSRGPVDSPLHQPDIMFETAYEHQMMAELDYICRRKAVENFVARNMPGKLSLNICPSAIVDPGFRSGHTLDILQEAGLSSDRVILELTEHKQTDISRLKSAVNYYKAMGFSIALDDLGAGYSNLRLLAELQPEFLKLDKYFVSGINHDRVEGKFVKLIVDLANRVGCQVIAEGIETADDLRFVQAMGVGYGQGYLLGRPKDQAVLSLPNILMETSKRSHTESFAPAAKIKAGTIRLPDREQIGSLRMHPTPACSPNDMLTAMLSRFQSNPQLQAVPVVEHGRVVGAVIRDELFEAFSKPFAHSLYHKSSVSKLMLEDPLVVKVDDSLATASQQATSRPYDLVYCPLIVCDGEKYIGMLSIRALLEKITQTQVEHALHCNPLTSLPGNVRIDSEVQVRLHSARDFVLSHFDLDNFKAFNDEYGYERGDQMIRLVADLLRDTTLNEDFVGHIGGDDFVIVLSGENWESRVWKILDTFAEQSRLLYNEKDRERGYIEAADRLGQIRQFALASLSVSAVVCTANKFTSHLEASEVIAEIKHQSKKIEGNSLVVDRRDDSVLKAVSSCQ